MSPAFTGILYHWAFWEALRGQATDQELNNKNNLWNQIQPPYSNPESILGYRVVDEMERNSFTALAGEGGHSGLMPSELCVLTWGELWGSGISLWTFFWLMSGEISGSQHHQPSGSNGSGVSLFMGNILLLPNGGFCICKTAQRYWYVYPLRGQETLPQACTIVSLRCSSPCLLSPPFLINRWLNLPFRTQGMKPIFCN